MLITFCNQIGKNALLEGHGYLLDEVSATGIAQDDENIYVVSPKPEPRLFKISKKNYKVISREIDAKDVHSIAVKGNSIYIVSSGENCVVEYSKNLNRKKVIYQPSEEHHINCVFIKDDIYISAFGSYEGEDRDTATNGYIYNLTKGRKEIEGIYHPHSVLVDDAIYYCESATGKVFRDKEELFCLPGHYLRGLAKDGNILTVGVSGKRQEAKDIGSTSFWGNCKIIKYDLDKKEFIGEIIFEDHYEIYDIVPIYR